MYDLIIIGSGPAGLTASIYASCFHLKHLVIGQVQGGQMINAPDVLNYPGFEEISGKELTEKMVNQVKKRGGEVVTQSVTKITNSKLTNEEGNYFEIETKEGSKYQTKAIILATGTERRKLNVPGEVEYTGRGIYYCATCGRQDYEGKICAVVGGANAAVQAAVELAQAATKVYIIYRGSELRGDQIWLSQVEKNPNIEVIYNSVVSEVVGDNEKVTGIKFKAVTGPVVQKNFAEVSKNPSADGLASPQNSKLFHVDRVFIEIGGVPGTSLVIPLGVEVDAGGYIVVNPRLATNVTGIFAAGDLVSNGLSIEQIATAIGLGARAAASAFAYLKKDKAPILWGESQIKR